MPLPHPRFTVRRLMIAVAIAAVGIAGVTEGILGRNRERCRRWAEHCERREARCRREATRFQACARGEHRDGRPTCPDCAQWTGRPSPAEAARIVTKMVANAASFADSARLFREGVERPWVRMPSDDPPSPE